MATTPSRVPNPRSASSAFVRLFTSRPDETSRTTAAATCAPTSTRRSRAPPRPSDPRVEPALSDRADDEPEACSAGASPNNRLLAIEMTAMNAIVRTSTDVSRSCACSAGKNDGSTSDVQSASSRPQTPPPIPSTRLSVSSCRTTRKSARAECQPHGHLAIAGDGSRHEQAGNVGAGDHEHQPDGRHEDRAHRCDHRPEVGWQAGMPQGDHRPRLGRCRERATVRLGI